MDVAAACCENCESQKIKAMKKLDYEQLASLPLFLGIDGSTLSSIYETINPVVAPMRKGNAIITSGEECRSLLFLLEGFVQASAAFGKNRFTIYELVHAVSVVEPQCLFGLHTTYTRNYTADSGGYYLRLPKSVIVRQMMENDVFLFNFTNMLSSLAQDTVNRLRRLPPQTTEAKITDLFSRQVLRPAGRKQIKCKMTDLAECVGETRLNVSRTLHKLEDAGLLSFTRGIIDIPYMEKLIAKVM